MGVIYLNFLEKKLYMNKLNKALYEIQSIEDLSSRDSFINNIHPLIKFILTITYIFLVVSIDKYNIGGVIGMSIYPIFLLIICDIPFKDTFKKLKIVLPLASGIALLKPLSQVFIQFNAIIS